MTNQLPELPSKHDTFNLPLYLLLLVVVLHVELVEAAATFSSSDGEDILKIYFIS